MLKALEVFLRQKESDKDRQLYQTTASREQGLSDKTKRSAKSFSDVFLHSLGTTQLHQPLSTPLRRKREMGTGCKTKRDGGVQGWERGKAEESIWEWERENLSSCLCATTSYSPVGDNNAASTQTHNLLSSTCILTAMVVILLQTSSPDISMIQKHSTDEHVAHYDPNQPS